MIDVAGEFQHSRFVPFHSNVDDRTGVFRWKSLVLSVNFQQKMFVSTVHAQRLFEHYRRRTICVHYQRELGLRFGSGYQVSYVRVRRKWFVSVKCPDISYDGCTFGETIKLVNLSDYTVRINGCNLNNKMV